MCSVCDVCHESALHPVLGAFSAVVNAFLPCLCSLMVSNLKFDYIAITLPGVKEFRCSTLRHDCVTLIIRAVGSLANFYLRWALTRESQGIGN